MAKEHVHGRSDPRRGRLLRQSKRLGIAFPCTFCDFNLTFDGFWSILQATQQKGILDMKKTLSVLLLLSLALVVLVSCASDPMAELPAGNKISESVSTDGTYKLELYLCVQSGTQYIRGAVTTVATGEVKNIYWDVYTDTLNVEWTDNTTVKVNDRSLDVTTDVYDCREAE